MWLNKETGEEVVLGAGERLVRLRSSLGCAVTYLDALPDGTRAARKGRVVEVLTDSGEWVEVSKKQGRPWARKC